MIFLTKENKNNKNFNMKMNENFYIVISNNKRNCIIIYPFVMIVLIQPSKNIVESTSEVEKEAVKFVILFSNRKRIFKLFTSVLTHGFIFFTA